MESQSEPKSQSLIYGLIYGLLSAVVLYAFYKFNIETRAITYLVNFALAAFCVLLPINLYKSTNANELQIADALRIGLFVGLIGAVIYAAYSYFHYELINPEFITETLTEAKNEVKNQNAEMTEEQMQQALQFTEMFLNPVVYAITGFLGALIETFLAALVIGLIKKSN